MNSTSLLVYFTGLATAITVTLCDGVSQFTFTGGLALSQANGSLALDGMYVGPASIEVQGSSPSVVILVAPLLTSLDTVTLNLQCQDPGVTVEYCVGTGAAHTAPSVNGAGFTITLPLS
jgi:hypothetical protein